MADILSNSELDDLLANVDTDQQQDASEEGPNVSIYDFRRPSRLTRDHVRILQPLNRAVADGLSVQLSELLRSNVEVNAIGIDALRFSNFINSLPSVACLNIFSLGEVVENGLLTMDVPLALAIVDRLLGGPGTPPDNIRPLTEVEDRVVNLPTNMALECIRENWRSVAEVDFEFVERRMDPKMLQIAPSSEVVLRIIFAVGGQIGSGEMVFLVPFSAIDKMMPREKMKERVQRAPKQSSEQELEALNRHLRQAPVKLTAMLGDTQLTLRELAELKVNHVLPLSRRVTSELDLLVQGVPKFKVRPGRSGRSLSVQICQASE